MLRIVATNPSQIEHVQFAAVNPPAHVGEYAAAPFRDDEAVYDGERVV
jgi:hypothetical protein